MEQPEKQKENKKPTWLTQWCDDKDLDVFNELKAKKLEKIAKLMEGVTADKSFKKDEVLTTTDIEGNVIPFLTELKLGGMVKKLTIDNGTNRLEPTLSTDWRGALAFCGDLTSFKTTNLRLSLDEKYQFGNEIVIELFEDLLDKLEEHNRPIRESNRKKREGEKKEEEAKFASVPGNHEFLHFCGQHDMDALIANDEGYQPKFDYGEGDEHFFYIKPKHALRIKVRAARILAKWQRYQFQQALENDYNINDNDYGDRYDKDENCNDEKTRLQRYIDELDEYITNCESLLKAICNNKKWDDIKSALEDLDPAVTDSNRTTYQDDRETQHEELIKDKRTHIQALKVLMVEHSALHSKCILSHKGKKLRVLHYVGLGADREDLPPYRYDWFTDPKLIEKWEEQCKNHKFFENLNYNKWNLGGVDNRINKDLGNIEYMNMTTYKANIFTISGHNGDSLLKNDPYQICIDDGSKFIDNDAFIFMQEGNMKRCIWGTDSETKEVISETMDDLDKPFPFQWQLKKQKEKKEKKENIENKKEEVVKEAKKEEEEAVKEANKEEVKKEDKETKKKEEAVKEANKKEEVVKEANKEEEEGVVKEANRRGNYPVPIIDRKSKNNNANADEFVDYEIIDGTKDDQNNKGNQQPEKTGAQDKKSNENEQNDQSHEKEEPETFEKLKNLSLNPQNKDYIFNNGNNNLQEQNNNNPPVNTANNKEDLKESINAGQGVNPFANNDGGEVKPKGLSSSLLRKTARFKDQNNEEKNEEEKNEAKEFAKPTNKGSIISFGGVNENQDNIFDDNNNHYNSELPGENIEEEKKSENQQEEKEENKEANIENKKEEEKKKLAKVLNRRNSADDKSSYDGSRKKMRIDFDIEDDFDRPESVKNKRRDDERNKRKEVQTRKEIQIDRDKMSDDNTARMNRPKIGYKIKKENDVSRSAKQRKINSPFIDGIVSKKEKQEEEKDILIDSNNESNGGIDKQDDNSEINSESYESYQENYKSNKRINEVYHNVEAQKRRSRSAGEQRRGYEIAKENNLIKKENDVRSMDGINSNNLVDAGQDKSLEWRLAFIEEMEKAGFDPLKDKEIKQYYDAVKKIEDAKLDKGMPENYHNFWEPLITAIIEGKDEKVSELTEINNPNRPTDIGQEAIVYALKCFNCIKPGMIKHYSGWDKFWSLGENTAKMRRTNQLWKIMEDRYTKNLVHSKKQFKQRLKNYERNLKETKARKLDRPHQTGIDLGELLDLAKIHSRWRCDCCGPGSVEVK